jgi:hypothetical protein
MLPIPENVLHQFNEVLKQRAVVESLQVHYRKYSPPETKSEQVRLFTEKLKSKKQTPQQCTQTAHAVSLFFESQKLRNGHRTASPPPTRPANQQPWPHNTKSTVLTSVSDPSGALPAISHLSDPHVSTGGKRYKELTLVPNTKKRRRYHLHESQLQEALKKQ